MSSYFAAGDKIIARLKETLPDTPCSIVWSLAEIQETKDPTLKLQVLFDLDRVGDSTTDCKNDQLEHTWVVLVMARAVEKDADPMIPQVIKTLAGWRPTAFCSLLKRTQCNLAPGRSGGGVYYFPIAFSTKFAFASLKEG